MEQHPLIKALLLAYFAASEKSEGQFVGYEPPLYAVVLRKAADGQMTVVEMRDMLARGLVTEQRFEAIIDSEIKNLRENQKAG